MNLDGGLSWTEEAKSRLNLALFGKTDKPLAWVQADGKLLYAEADAEPHQRVYPLFAAPQPAGPEEPPQDWKDIFHEYRRHGRTDAWLYMEIQAHAIRALKNAAPQCPAPEPTKVHSQTKDGEPARASSEAGKERERNLYKALVMLTNGSAFDLTDSPKSFIETVKRLLDECAVLSATAHSGGTDGK